MMSCVTQIAALGLRHSFAQAVGRVVGRQISAELFLWDCPQMKRVIKPKVVA